MKTFIRRIFITYLTYKIIYSILEGVDCITDKNMPCWDFFDCPKKFRDKCYVYKNYHLDKDNVDCWFLTDWIDGGPAKRGPCYKCPIFKANYPEITESMVSSL